MVRDSWCQQKSSLGKRSEDCRAAHEVSIIKRHSADEFLGPSTLLSYVGFSCWLVGAVVKSNLLFGGPAAAS
jgi:hypothetical protein